MRPRCRSTRTDILRRSRAVRAHLQVAGHLQDDQADYPLSAQLSPRGVHAPLRLRADDVGDRALEAFQRVMRRSGVSGELLLAEARFPSAPQRRARGQCLLQFGNPLSCGADELRHIRIRVVTCVRRLPMRRNSCDASHDDRASPAFLNICSQKGGPRT
jgi:hypothetical protein